MEAIVKSFHSLMDKLENELSQSNFVEVNKILNKIEKVENNLIAHLSIQEKTKNFSCNSIILFWRKTKYTQWVLTIKLKNLEMALLRFKGISRTKQL